MLHLRRIAALTVAHFIIIKVTLHCKPDLRQMRFTAKTFEKHSKTLKHLPNLQHGNGLRHQKCFINDYTDRIPNRCVIVRLRHQYRPQNRYPHGYGYAMQMAVI